MNPKKYIELVKKTESSNFVEITQRMSDPSYIRLDHASDGLVTEAGEFKDAIKKYKFYGKPVDAINLIEELGDILWYVAIACDELSIDIEDVMTRNIAKLQKRYGIIFNEEGAINRDLSAERYVLNKGLAVMCEHANEVPLNCKCDLDCYCKTHTCAIHYRIPGGSITSPCGIVGTRYSFSIQEITCKRCLGAVKVNYEGEILHFNTHGLEIDRQPASRVCGAETGLMIGDPKRVTCAKCKEEMVRLHFDRMQ